MNKCPFKKLEKLTEWYFPDGSVKPKEDETPTYPDGTILCRDLHDRGFKYRILCVIQGEQYHHPESFYSESKKNLMIERLWRVAFAHLDQGKAKIFAGFDSEHFTIKNHFHIQGKLLDKDEE